MDKAKVKALREQLQEVIDTHLPEVVGGVSVKVGNAVFDPALGRVTFKVEVVEGNADDVAKKEWERYAPMYELPVEAFGKTIKYDGLRSFTLSGFSPKSSRFPVLARNQAGKVFKLTVDGVRRALAAK